MQAFDGFGNGITGKWNHPMKTFKQFIETAEDREDIYNYDQAEKYFSIGQGEYIGICWCIIDGQLYKKRGGTHASNWGVYARDVWQGWLDTSQGLMSVVIPPTDPNYKKHFTMISDIPSEIMDILNKGF